jgi:hypothetical protein
MSSKKDLTILINHLEKYPPLGLTQKAADFILFNQVVKHCNNKDHLSIEGLKTNKKNNKNKKYLILKHQ